MYRPEDIIKINDNIDKIKEDAQYAYKQTNDPTFKETSNVCKEIINFIRKKKELFMVVMLKIY